MPNQTTYNYNSEEVVFEKLPESIKIAILGAEDFWRQLDSASSHEERERILAEHPQNQT